MPRLFPPKDGSAAVRMYRTGHGDCFLLAFAPDPEQAPKQKACYVLIDCGYKPGSDKVLHEREVIDDVVGHIVDATGGRIDLFIVTHEHQDHVNGIWKRFDERFEILEAWFPWTESPKDPDAITLRKRHHDQLLGLVAARRQLAFGADSPESERSTRALDELLDMEFGGFDDDEAGAVALGLNGVAKAVKDPSKSINKQGMKTVRDKAELHRGARYLDPRDGPLSVVGSAGVRAFVLGPPRDAALFADEDPVGSMGFPRDETAAALTFGAAARALDDPSPGMEGIGSPFSKIYHVSEERRKEEPLFRNVYGVGSNPDPEPEDGTKAPDGGTWRRIDRDWLMSAENLALVMNTGINNTSLVLAFELPKSKKILLFVGDAQAGNWKTWTAQTWKDGDREVTARDLLGRTVLYKVGHHGSHNATMAGTEADDYANLSWMGQGAYGSEFTAMITAVNAWAEKVTPKPWHHPLPAIKKALLAKAEGRVFQTDMASPPPIDHDTPEGLAAFWKKCGFDELHFDLTITDG